MNLGETLGRFTDFVTRSLVGGDDGYDIIDMEPGDFGGVSYGTDSNAALQPTYDEAPRKSEKSNVKRLPGTNYKNHEVRISEPRSFRDATEIVTQLLDNRTVILNLHLLDKETAQKTIDFVCGATFAMDGKVKKVGDTVFIFTPNCVQLSVEAQETASYGTDSFWGNLQ